jgi:hypothetical protein
MFMIALFADDDSAQAIQKFCKLLKIVDKVFIGDVV